LKNVIVWAEHEERHLRVCLESLAALRRAGDDIEVLVVDAGNEPGRPTYAAALVQGFGVGFRLLLAGGETRRPVLYNRAVAVAAGDFVLFTHDDASCPAGWPDAITAALTDPQVGFSSGEDVVPPDARDFLSSLDYVLKNPIASGGMRSDRGLRIGRFTPRNWNMACRREVLEHVGGFDPDSGDCTEAAVAERLVSAGYRIAYVPEARVFHLRDTTLRGSTANSYARGRDRVTQLGRTSLGGDFPHIAAAVLTVGLPASVVAGFTFPALILPVAVYASILTVLAVDSMRVWRRPSVLIWTPLLVMSQHFGHGAGFIAGLIQRLSARATRGRLSGDASGSR
jgi:GT2 family glycosyltransferase